MSKQSNNEEIFWYHYGTLFFESHDVCLLISLNFTIYITNCKAASLNVSLYWTNVKITVIFNSTQANMSNLVCRNQLVITCLLFIVVNDTFKSSLIFSFVNNYFIFDSFQNIYFVKCLWNNLIFIFAELITLHIQFKNRIKIF